MINILLPVIAIFSIGIIFKTVVSNTNLNNIKTFKKVMEEEQRANFSRFKEIPQDLIITASPTFLNEIEFEKYDNLEDYTINTLIKYKNLLLIKSNRHMMRLNPLLANKELKKQFGIANLDNIIKGEENYYDYVHTLNTFAESLIKHNQYENAKKVLSHAIYDIDSNIIKSYSLLISLYKSIGEEHKIKEFEEHLNKIETLQNDIEFKGKLLELVKSFK